MKFKRINRHTKFTFPCMVAWRSRIDDRRWQPTVLENGPVDVSIYTHWMPFEWPEVRGE